MNDEEARIIDKIFQTYIQYPFERRKSRWLNTERGILSLLPDDAHGRVDALMKIHDKIDESDDQVRMEIFYILALLGMHSKDSKTP